MKRCPEFIEGLKHNPFPLIFTQGDETTKLACLEFFGQQDSPQAKGCLSKLIKQQRSDGAFPSHLDPGNWGMRETVRNTLLLLKLRLPPKGVNVDSAVQFILSHQSSDGGWSENPSLEIPPEKLELSNQRSITWVTADVVELLRREDGGWRPFWAEDSSPVYTALAVKVLVLSGMLTRENFETAVNAYAI